MANFLFLLDTFCFFLCVWEMLVCQSASLSVLLKGAQSWNRYAYNLISLKFLLLDRTKYFLLNWSCLIINVWDAVLLVVFSAFSEVKSTVWSSLQLLEHKNTVWISRNRIKLWVLSLCSQSQELVQEEHLCGYAAERLPQILHWALQSHGAVGCPEGDSESEVPYLATEALGGAAG